MSIRGKTVAFGVLLAALAAAAGGLSFEARTLLRQLRFERHRVELLDAENQRLRGVLAGQEKARAESENLAKRAEIERTVSRLRELPFKTPVAYAVLTRAGIQRVLAQKIGEQMSDEEIQNAATGLAAFGLLPRNYPLKQKYIELLGEQVAAFYDQHAHKLFMFEDALLSNAQNRVILAHELTHALQDQNFGLAKLPLEIRDNDDRAAAASALVEGDATLLMTQYMAQNISLDALRDTLAGAVTQNTEQLRKAPRYLREMLIFPYLRGQEFCAALYARGGWAAVSAAYKNPPRSTSEILHPEKFLANPREEPVKIDFGNDLTVLGEKPLADNVLGEMGTRILLFEQGDQKWAEEAASGWRGDRYLVFHGGDALVWRVMLDAPMHTDSFHGALKYTLMERYHFGMAHDADMPRGGRFPPLIFHTPRAIRLFHLQKTNEIVLIDAKDEKWADALADKFAR